MLEAKMTKTLLNHIQLNHHLMLPSKFNYDYLLIFSLAKHFKT